MRTRDSERRLMGYSYRSTGQVLEVYSCGQPKQTPDTVGKKPEALQGKRH